MENIKVPISPGELLDKITILEIKSENIEDKEKLANIETELKLLSQIWGNTNPDSDLEALKQELKDTGVGITVVSTIMVRTNFFEHPSFENMPKFSPTSLSSKTVAKAILKAANSPRLEIIVPSVVRGAVWFKNTFPFLINPIMGKAFKKQLDSMKKD